MLTQRGPRPLALKTTRVMGAAEIRLSGECDLANVPELSAEIEAAEDARRVVLDLSELDFIDSSGLRVLVYAVEDAERSGRTLTLRSGSPDLMRVFEITGLADRLPFE